MTEIYRLRSAWTGFVGGPGVTTMYFLDTATAVASVHTFWNDIKAQIPSDVTITVEPSGDIIEDSTGALTGTWTSDASTPITCTGDGEYAAPVGGVINWLTETIGPHRRLKGRSFIVPTTGNMFQNDGSYGTAPRATLQSAADALIAAQSTSFVVYHRGTGSDGTNGLVTSAFVPDMAAVLRSRRD